MQSQAIGIGRMRTGRTGRARRGARAASVLLAAFSAIVATVGLSIATSAVASAATTWSSPSQIAVPTTSLSGSLAGVSCVDSTDCTAVDPPAVSVE